MGRALTLQRSIVPLGDRKRYLERLSTRKALYAKANCRFWVFEETDLAGAFIEFIEAPDGETLSRGLQTAQDHFVDAARVYEEVEIH